MKNTTPRHELLKLAQEWGLSPSSMEFARRLDLEDPLRELRQRFSVPKMADMSGVDPAFIESKEQECTYLCGHLLGLKPKAADANFQKVLDNWGRRGMQCIKEGYLPIATCDQNPKQLMADLVGADREEITFMNALTVNLHLLMMTYYRPQGKRCKMVIEADTFSSDMYAAQSQVSHHGLDVASNLIVLRPRKGEFLLREEDIYELLIEDGDTIALLLLGGLQLYTGQALDVRGITSAARKKGCVVLWDLAHCVGNTELRLNEWEVDLAVWCTYKYLNSGPGCMGVAYVRHQFREETGRLPELRGWGGNNIKTKHLQRPEFDPSQSADVFKLSNAPPFHVAPIMASLEVFGEIREADRLRKQFLLTGYLELLLIDEFGASHDHEDSTCPVHILTPADAARRGSQISILVTHDPQSTCRELLRRGIICDSRPPSVIRLTPVPLYNTFEDVYNSIRVMGNIGVGIPPKETPTTNG